MAVVDDLKARREKLTPAQRALLDKRLRGEARAASAPIQPRSDQDSIPVSFTQERLWLVNQIDGADPRYNMSSIYRITGELNATALQQALQAIVDRQAVLRTNFVAVQGVPQPIINDHAPINFQVFELTTLPPQEAETRSLQLLQQEIQRPFDLTRDVMLRAVLIKQSDGQFLLALIRHHIATDGWSTRIMQQELTALYAQANSLPVLAAQYADYAAWQRAQFDQGAFEKDIAFWEQQLAGPLPILELPTDHPRPSLQTWRGASEYLMLPVELVQRAREFSHRERLTLFMTLLASFDVLLYRYTAQTDILVGTPVANRLHVETEKMIGPFFNMLVMRSRLSGDLSFRRLMSQVRDTTLTAYDHQRAPFEKIVEVIQPDRDLGHSPVFQVMFALQNFPRAPLNLIGLAVEEVEFDRGVAQYDLTLEISEQTDGLRCSIEYNTDLFEAGTISRMLGHYQNILAAAIADPDRSIATLPWLTEVERRQLLIEWNLTAQAYPLDRCLQHLFEAQVERTPDRPAVIFKDAHLTYTELNRRANRLAHYLIDCGVKPDDLVAIYVEPSLEMIVAILGTLKAGGAYVPLDSSNPAKRLELMLRDSNAKMILTLDRLADQLPQHVVPILRLDSDRSVRGQQITNPRTDCRPDNLAYVIYTSGSSGQPKGVMIEHRSVVNNAWYCIQLLGLQPIDRVLQFASISFDGSVEEIFPTLLCGAGLVLRPKELELNLKDFLDFMRVQHLTVLEPPTAFWHQLTQDIVEGGTQLPTAIRLLFVGGEKASAAVLAAWLKIEGERVRWLNGYGPTEATSSVITYEAFASRPSINPLADVPIGRPDPNTQVYILDDLLQPVPVGVPGELHLGGVCLARGYLNQPELTAQKFIPDPFDGQPKSRLYKTGDLARYRPDGNIEFIGRVDGQIKLRGLRIELGEIEAALLRHASVHSAVVTTREFGPDDKQLVAYVILKHNSPVTPIDLQNSLRQLMPSYMVPAAIVIMSDFPLTTSGKIDHRTLPAPDRLSMTTDRAFIGPRTPTEAALVRLWSKLLNLDRISVRSNFFELGGHSLLAARLFSQIEQEFQRKLPLVALFQAPTIEQLAEVIQQTSWSARWSPLVPIQVGGSKSPLFFVHGGGGGPLTFGKLAAALGADQPVYAFQARGFDDQLRPHTRIEDMAVEYIAAMRTVQPRGPYYLNGYSMGGSVAFEMARQVTQQAETVAWLGILDTSAPGTYMRWLRMSIHAAAGILRRDTDWETRVDERLGNHLRFYLWLPFGELLKRVPRKFLARLSGKRPSTPLPSNSFMPEFAEMPEANQELFKANSRALRDYKPGLYSGKIMLFKTTRGPLYAPYVRDPQMGWGKLTLGGVETIMIDGNHDELVRSDRQVSVLAAQFRSRLAALPFQAK